MIASVHGLVLAVALDHVVVEVGGLGLAIRATPETLAGLRRDERVRLFTTLVVREDSLTLFGFGSPEAKELFELVQSVSGVGPKIALALLAVLAPDDLRQALANGDTTSLTRAPGIGKKGAERLVLELRDKAGAIRGSAGPAGSAAASGRSGDAWREQLLDALEGLGFATKQAADAVDRVAAEPATSSTEAAPVDGSVDIAVLLRRALAILGRSR